MKSTGLFGKNSGRVGGVVYSNYRGIQVVRSYQPQVKNPSTRGQVAQRAKFKLVSQVGSVLGEEIRRSYVPTSQMMTGRNAWLKKMLMAASYSNDEAILPLESLVLTNGDYGHLEMESDNNSATAPIDLTFHAPSIPSDNNSGQLAEIKARVTLVAYNVDGELVNFGTREFSMQQVDSLSNEYVQNVQLAQPEFFPVLQNEPVGYSNFRALFYVYDLGQNVSISYEDYGLTANDATLEVLQNVYNGNFRFSPTLNVGLVLNS